MGLVNNYILSKFGFAQLNLNSLLISFFNLHLEVETYVNVPVVHLCSVIEINTKLLFRYLISTVVLS